MKYSLYFTIALLAISTFISSCGSDDEPNPNSNEECATRKGYLTGNSNQTWKLSKVEVDVPNLGVVNIFDPLILSTLGSPENITCLQDNTVSFNVNGNFIGSEGANVCDGFPSTGSGKWSFSSNCDSLRFEANDSLIFLQNPTLPITSFTESEFVSEVKIDIDTVFETTIFNTTVSVGPILDSKVTFGKQ